MSEKSNLINQSKIHLIKYQYEKVIECCNKILEIEPESWWGLKFKGISLYQTGKYDDAIPIYEKRCKLYPKDVDTISTLIEMYEKKEKHDEALELYKELLKHYEKKGRIYRIFKNREKLLKTRMGRYDEIIREYDKEIEKIKTRNGRLITPEDKISMIERKKVLVLLEEKAVYQYKNMEFDNAYETYKIVSQIYPTFKHTAKNHEIFINSWYKMLERLLDNHESNQKFFEDFFNFDKNTKAWVKKITHRLFEIQDPIVYSEILLEKNPDNIELLQCIAENTKYYDIDYSLYCWKKILNLDSNNSKAIEEILDIYSKQYSNDRAIKLINSKLYLDDIKPKLLVKKIRLLESMTLYDEALETYAEYLSLDLPDGLIYHELTIFDKLRCMEEKAIRLYLEKNLSEAFEIYKNIFELFNNTSRKDDVINTTEWTIEDWYKDILGKSIEKSNDKAETFFNELFTINSENTKYWVEKIEFLRWERLGDPITYCDILLEKYPDNAEILLAKAEFYYWHKRLQKALTLYEKILKEYSSNTVVKNRKFTILIELKDYGQAYNVLKTINEDYRKISREITKLADYLLKEKKCEESKYCYEILLKEDMLYDKDFSQLKYIWDKTNDTESQKQSPYYLDWIDLINYKHEKYECPYCGGKLIRIKYGYFRPDPEKIGVEYVMGGCCYGDSSPSDCCTKCRKEVHMGTYGIDITLDDYQLFCYTQDKIIWLTKTLEKYPKKTINEIEEEAYNKFSLDNKEFYAFLEKLEKISHIKIDNTTIKLNKDYKLFEHKQILS